ncbi:aminoacyl-tRNA hydrolase [Neochlamydia sp. AcF84]|uniref:aminoacyl-tRNA hydrolase n=1 Tax=Neochlamydia sp. AcF84 TaxID=2315858 RepID=UPI00140895EF|nr:aminoacyl-tRNA hydrolase [Neochlamydia sp. AcF84]
MHRLFVGLGNPGKKYELTRHNIGFMVLQEWALNLGVPFKEKPQLQGWIAKTAWNETTIHLLMPTTYMNGSGQAVRRYMDYVKLVPDNLVVIVDDVALPYGHMRLRTEGGAGGHNGLKSIEAYLGTQRYTRLRMGIGDHGSGSLADYVLDNFTPEEQKVLPTYIKQAVDVLKQLMNESITEVMKTVNKQPQ